MTVPQKALGLMTGGFLLIPLRMAAANASFGDSQMENAGPSTQDFSHNYLKFRKPEAVSGSKSAANSVIIFVISVAPLLYFSNA